MYQQPIFLKPVFKDRIWGGIKLNDIYGYDIPTATTGECWGISAHPNGPNEILNGPLKGITFKRSLGKTP
jgi:mannose-6-phosphate isomerase